MSGRSVLDNRSGGKGRPVHLGAQITLWLNTVLVWESLLLSIAQYHFNNWFIMSIRTKILTLLDSTFHHLKFSSLKMWTFATLCVPQITSPGHIPCNKILLISTTPCFQAPNSFKMLRRMLLFYWVCMTNKENFSISSHYLTSCVLSSFNYF